MEEAIPARPVDVDRLEEAWLLASPIALLHLLKMLGIRQQPIAERLGVPKSNVSMWYHGRQPVPRRYGTVLRVWGQRALQEKEVEWGKALRESPTAAERNRLERLYYDPVFQWIYRVHLEAGTFDQRIRLYIRQLETIVLRDVLRPEDENDIETLALRLARMVLAQRTARLAQETQTAQDPTEDERDDQ